MSASSEAGPMVHELVFHTELSRAAEIVMTVIGDVDAANAHQLVDGCDQPSAQCDVVDLRFVSMFSAAGISALLSMRDAHPLRVVASTAVQRILEVTGLNDVFEVSAPAGPPQLHRAPFGVAVHDPDLRFRYVNDALASINGLVPKPTTDAAPTSCSTSGAMSCRPFCDQCSTPGSNTPPTSSATPLRCRVGCGGVGTGGPATRLGRMGGSSRSSSPPLNPSPPRHLRHLHCRLERH